MRLSTRAFLALTLVLASGQLASAQPAMENRTTTAPQSLIAAADLKADLAVLRDAFETIHPGLYRYNTRAQIAARFAELESAFERDQTRQQAFLTLSRFAATIKCGHTFLNPSNQASAVADELFKQQDKVPFYFRWLDRRMVVTRDFTPDGQLRIGTEILEINGVPAAAILEQLMTIARADGSNDAKRINLLEVTGSERYETFDIYFPLLFPLSRPQFELKVRLPGASADTTLTTAALSYQARLAAHDAAESSPETGDQPLWKLSYLADGTAYLPMPSWVAYKTSWDWTGFINTTFDAIIQRKVANLVIDLRGNEGGSSVGDVILARLIESPVPRTPGQRFVRYLKVPPQLDAVLDTWDPSFKDWSKEALGPMDLADRATGLPADATSGFYRLRNEDGSDPALSDELVTPRGPRFTGRIFVIIGASNSSATFEFASLIKSLKLGTLVGQATGGNQRGINGGAFFFVRLPRTGFEVDLPIMSQYPKQRGELAPDAGVLPDVSVDSTLDDLVSGHDAQLRTVQQLINAAK